MENIFYSVVIYSLTQIIELSFSLCYKIFGSTSISLFGVSFAVSMLTLPLYIVAEHWQGIERNKQKTMKPEIDRIKRVFKGNEQYMILTTYYRQCHYHPIMSLRSAFGLLIQIPFFTAAYTCLSNMEALKGQHFWIFHDLGAQDAFFKIGTFNVNILPILMTVINIAASAVYLKGLPIREKIQTYSLAALFLVLLYDRPAGLVIYWTMNQVFSLVKNIFYRIKKPLQTLYFLMCVMVTIIIVWMFVAKALSVKRALLVSTVFALVYFVPLIIRGVNFITENFLFNLIQNKMERFLLFIFCAMGLCLLTGWLIPTLLISSSPMEFSGIDGYGSPVFFIKNTFLQAFGLCIVWPVLIYFLYKNKTQAIISFLFCFLLIASLLNCFVFAENYGTLSTSLKFVEITTVDSSITGIFFNALAMAAVAATLLAVFKLKSQKILIHISIMVCAALIVFGTIKIYAINAEYKRYQIAMESGNSTSKDLSPIFHISKTGQNVILIFVDRAQNRFIEPMFEEFLEFKKIFDGFTLYKNTVSFNSHTLIAAPPAYGGYEYTPEEINKRPAELLKDKHNEAVTMLPRIFTEQGKDYTSTITEPSWANYSWISDLSIFDEYPKISAYLTAGKYTNKWLKENVSETDSTVISDLLKRNILWYSLFKTSPLFLRPAFYNDGKYWNANNKNENFSKYIEWYSVLDYLPELTDFNTSSENSYISLVNETTHTHTILQQPEYVPLPKVDNSKVPVTKFSLDAGWNSNVGMMKKISEYMAFLKENSVYDNSRIIIYSDHGSDAFEEDFNWNEEFAAIGPGKYHPLLMVKDFNESGELKINNDFMTNADVPTLATKGIVENPINPYSGQPLDSTKKADGALVCLSNKFMPFHFSSNKVFTVDKNDWVRVKENIFDSSNWQKETHSFEEIK